MRGRGAARPHEVDSQVESGLDRGIRDVGGGKRDELDVHDVRELGAHLGQRPHAPQRFVAHQQVDMAAHRRGAVAEHPEGGVARAVGYRLDRHHGGVRAPRLDRLDEIAGGRVDEVPGERLVQVRVRLGGRGEQHVAREVHYRIAGCLDLGLGRAHGPHDVLDELDVDEGSVGERGVPQQGEPARKC